MSVKGVVDVERGRRHFLHDPNTLFLPQPANTFDWHTDGTTLRDTTTTKAFNIALPIMGIFFMYVEAGLEGLMFDGLTLGVLVLVGTLQRASTGE